MQRRRTGLARPQPFNRLLGKSRLEFGELLLEILDDGLEVGDVRCQVLGF